MTRETLERTKKAMNYAFPDGNIENFEVLIECLTLPDKNDRHVLAAAIKGQVNIIVTNNVKDFPEEYINRFDIEVSDADTFVRNLIDLDRDKSIETLDSRKES